MTQYIHIIVEYSSERDEDYSEDIFELYTDLALAEMRLSALQAADDTIAYYHHGYVLRTIPVRDNLTDEEIMAARKHVNLWERTRERMANPLYAEGVAAAIRGETDLPEDKSDRIIYERGRKDYINGIVVLEL